jgi:His-Xaa-Ser repeat protein HxsA
MGNFFKNVSLFIAKRGDAAALPDEQPAPDAAGPDSAPDAAPTTALVALKGDAGAMPAAHRPHDDRRLRTGGGLDRSGNGEALVSPSGQLPLMAFPLRRETPAPQKSRQSRALNAIVRASTSAVVVVPPPVTIARTARSRVPHRSGVALTETERIRLQVMQVQIRLTGLDLYDGPIDGILNPETATGVRHFQTLKGMRDTGTLTAGTLSALGVAPLA